MGGFPGLLSFVWDTGGSSCTLSIKFLQVSFNIFSPYMESVMLLSQSLIGFLIESAEQSMPPPLCCTN